MKKIETEILIDAKPEKVWGILTDFDKYPDWNPFIRSIKGDKSAGKSISVFLKLPRSNGMTIRPVIMKFDPGKELRWKGKLGLGGLFDGEHYFILEKSGDTQTRFIHGEKFSGILTSMMPKILDRTRKGFILMNEAIKKESEKQE